MNITHRPPSTLSLILATATALALATPVFAADLALPAPSPLARVMQTVGVAQVTAEYSSPGVKGRKIFGGLLPYGKIWRTGANACTKLTFSTDAMVAGKAVPAGNYAVFTIPGKLSWTLILNKNTKQGGTRQYDAKLDQLRLVVKPATVAKRERLAFLFANTTDTGTRLDLEWDTVRVSMPITFDTAALAKANIKQAQRAAWRELARSASYLFGLKDYEGALKLVDLSLKVEEDFYNAFIKARILHAKGDESGAQKWAQKASGLGQKASYFFWKDNVAAALKGKW